MKVKSAIYKTGLTLGVMVLGLVAMVQGVSGLGYQKSVGVQFTFEPMLAISLSSADLIIPNLAPGSSDYSNTITVRVDTNSLGGYTLSAKVGNGTSYTNDKLTNSSGAVFNNLSSNSNLTLAQFSDSDWGYALGTVSGSSTYSGLVYDTDTVINATTNSAGTAASSGCVSTCSGTNNTKFTIAAKASATQASGDYKNVIIFTVVGNVVPLTIHDLTYLQDFASLSASDKTSVLTSMTQGQSYSLLDKRDSRSYRIAKLADGNAWTLDNLALNIINVDLNTLKGNTNASDLSLEYLKGVHVRGDGTSSADNKYPIEGVRYFDGNDDSFGSPEIAVAGDCGKGGCVDDPESGKWTSDSVTSVIIYDNTTIAQGKIGVYYNYCTVSAGTYCYGNGSSSRGFPSSDLDPSSLQDIKEDICPSGWRLPTGSTNGEYNALYHQYNDSSSDFVIALSTPLSGYVGYSKGEELANYQGSMGTFWTSTSITSNSRYPAGVTINTNLVDPGTTGNLVDQGQSVRCILDS